MTAVQMLIIVLFFTGTGWLISFIILRLLFSEKIKIKLVSKAGLMAQQEFESSGIIEQQAADGLLFEKMKPEIEKHVDVFLNEKLADIFPLLYKFMGEKTLSQFKSAFMAETDLLFPIIIKNYITELKKHIRLDTVITQRLNGIPLPTIRTAFYTKARKEFLFFKLACTLTGFFAGILLLLILWLAGR